MASVAHHTATRFWKMFIIYWGGDKMDKILQIFSNGFSLMKIIIFQNFNLYFIEIEILLPRFQSKLLAWHQWGKKPLSKPMTNVDLVHIAGILPKGPCLPMADRALLAGYPRYMVSLSLNVITHLPLVQYLCISELSQHWLMKWLFTCSACSVQSHCLNQCWLTINWTLRNKLQWNSNQNAELFIYKIHLKMSSAKWWPFCPGEMS